MSMSMTENDGNSKIKLLSPRVELSLGKEKSNKKQLQIQMGNDLDFKAKEEADIIKVAGCTYANDSKVKSTFFFCQCSSEDFYPVCKACAESCHADHKPGLKLKGVYVCMCGKNNHVITHENNKRFQDKKISMKNHCFYSQFSKITPSRGYKKSKDGTTYCSVCLHYCLDKDQKEGLISLDVDNEEDAICQCVKHYENNIINLNVDFLEKKHFIEHFQNFNFNILYKNMVSKEKYIDFLIALIHETGSKQTYDSSFAFFSNVFILKILTLYTEFNNRNTNKFFHIGPFLQDIKPEVLLRLVTFDEPPSMLDEISAPDYVISKIYFTGIVFDHLIKSFYHKHNMLFSNKTILNMNTFQRVIFLLDSKHYFMFDPKKERDVHRPDQLFNEFTEKLLEQYENILKINDNIDLNNEILESVFPLFTEMFKFLIKYNITSKENRMKYFELVLDTFLIIEKKEHYFGSEINIIKCLLYSLIYMNDLNFMDFIRSSNDIETGDYRKKFCFKPNNESDTISKIFLKLVNKNKRSNNFKKTLKYDEYVAKVLELLIGKNELFVISLENLYTLNKADLGMISGFGENSEVSKEFMSGEKDESYFTELSKIASRMNNENRHYFEYSINYDDYSKNTNEIFKKFEDFFNSQTKGSIKNLKNLFTIYSENISNDSEVNSNIKTLQKVLKYTTLAQKIDEFFHIYADAKKVHYSSNHSKEVFYKVDESCLKLILKFLYLYLYNNHEGMFIVENFNGQNFAITCIDIKEDFFDYLNILSYTYFTKTENDYKKENYGFFFEVFNTIINRIEFNEEDTNNDNLFSNLGIMSKVLNITKRCIRMASMKQPIILNFLEAVFNKLLEIKACSHLNRYIVDYLLGDESEILTIKNELKPPYIQSIIINKIRYHQIHEKLLRLS